MHPEAYEGFQWALQDCGVQIPNKARVLDIGGQMVNGSVHDLLPKDAVITTLDLENADIIADATTWEPDQQYDVVMATEVFEHVADWPAVITTMLRALTPDGVFLATCASTNRPAHGATGAPLPLPGEHYCNVDPGELADMLTLYAASSKVRYQYPPGDAYMWARP